MPATKTRKTRRAPGSKSAKFTEQRRAEVAALRDRLGEFTPDQAAMITMALIEKSGYSSRNASLVAMQMPGATDIAGYRDWQARGRQVRKGETGIASWPRRAQSIRGRGESSPSAMGERSDVTDPISRPPPRETWSMTARPMTPRRRPRYAQTQASPPRTPPAGRTTSMTDRGLGARGAAVSAGEV